jgi:2-desacetyl-2-hydroxyethyl bacteriochlorophyllide A dehydrogenase
MKGVMFTAKGVTRIIAEPMPVCGPDQMLLETLYSGISNGTERSFLVGGPYGGNKWPNRIGYLNVSRVVEKGSNVHSYDVGAILYSGTFPGHVQYHLAKEHDLIAELPPGLDSKAATMLGIAGVSYFNAKRVEVKSGDRVLITGGGAIGLMAVQAVKSMGAWATVISATPRRRERAAAMGADAVCDSPKNSDGLTAGGPYSVLLECAGMPLDSFMEPGKSLLDRFARVALVAGRLRVDYPFLWASMLRLSFHQSTHFDQATLDTVTTLAAKGALDLGTLVNDVVPIDDAVRVYDALRDDPMSAGGTVFDWTGL